jgi:hypothetical protein
MARTVIGVFDTVQAAEATIQDLADKGIDRSHISIVANDAAGKYRDTKAVGESRAAEDAGKGAVGGGVLGGVLGLLVGLGALAIPGIGPVLAAGPLAAAAGTAAAAIGTAAAGAGIGAAAGGLLGALVGAGVPEEHAHVYAESVRRGGTLVSVHPENDYQTDLAQRIMNENHAIDIEARRREWSSAGWERFDPEAGTWEERTRLGTERGPASGEATGAALGTPLNPGTMVVGGATGTIIGPGISGAPGTPDDVVNRQLEEDDPAYAERSIRKNDPAP